jgi:hypothetical protein
MPKVLASAPRHKRHRGNKDKHLKISAALKKIEASSPGEFPKKLAGKMASAV